MTQGFQEKCLCGRLAGMPVVLLLVLSWSGSAVALVNPGLHEDGALSYPVRMIEIFILLSLVVLLYAVNAWRIGRIEKIVQRLGEGDFSARANLRGGDPAARLGRCLNSVIGDLAAERQRLLDSEERLKVALQGCDIAIWDWRLDQGVTYYSPRWKSLLGFAEDDPLVGGDAWLQRVHPDDLPVVTRALEAHMSGSQDFFVSEHRLRHRDGEYLWVQQSGVASRNEAGAVVRMIGAMADISRRREAEQALLRSREAYRSVLEGVTQIIFRADSDGRLVFLNAAWEELTGYPVDTGIGATLQSFVAEEERKRLSGFFQQANAGEERKFAHELRLRCANGSWRWFILNLRATSLGGVSLLAGVLSDIEAQKSSEAALLRSNKIRDAILQLGPDGFVFVDDQGNVSFVNPAFVEMTGLSDQACVGLPLANLDRRLGMLAEGEPGFALAGEDGDGLLQMKPPRKVVIRWLLRTMPDVGDGVQGRVIYLRDITRESEVDRMKSDFLSTAAHELRTPMSSIFGFSEMLLSREFEPAMQKDLLERIHRQTRNLINLVNELLDLSRIEARGGKSFRMAVQEITPVVLNALAAQYVPNTHRLEFDWPKILPKVKVDGEKFLQCIINVLSNAFKYSPNGGTVRVSSAIRGEPGTEMLGLRVADQGIGMTPEQSRRVFDRFFRADASGSIPGTGLGMSLVKEYMNIFGGEVEVSSVLGQGTEVTLWLPVVPEQQALPGAIQ
jgi:PAS domain S-box-containing protein